MVKKVIVHFKDVFSPLKNRNLRLFWTGQSISLIGIWMQQIAQSWVVWELTKSTVDLGTVAMLGLLPFMFLAPFSGSLADRTDRRKLLIYTQLAAMLLAFILAYLVFTNLVQIWHIYVLALLLGIVNAFDVTANFAFISDLAGAEIRKAVVINNMIFQISRMLGPAIGGVVVGAFGAALAFFVNGITFLAVIASLLVITTHQQIKKGQDGNSFSQFREAVGFVKNNSLIFGMVTLMAIVTFFVIPVMFILPAFVGQVLQGDAAVLGILMAASGAGALVGSLFIAPLAQQVRKTGLMLAVSVAWTAAWLIMFSFSSQLQLAMIAMFFTSLLMPVIFTTTSGLTQLMAPPHMRARMVAITMMVSFGAQPIASLLLGYSADILNIQTALMLNGIAMLAATSLLFLIRPDMRSWETKIEIETKGPPTIAGKK